MPWIPFPSTYIGSPVMAAFSASPSPQGRWTKPGSRGPKPLVIFSDPAAAMRYTECKLTALARDALLADVAQNTVDFADNFDGSEREPEVLPARLPMLLLNGASGIAVGMASSGRSP